MGAGMDFLLGTNTVEEERLKRLESQTGLEDRLKAERVAAANAKLDALLAQSQNKIGVTQSPEEEKYAQSAARYSTDVANSGQDWLMDKNVDINKLASGQVAKELGLNKPKPTLGRITDELAPYSDLPQVKGYIENKQKEEMLNLKSTSPTGSRGSTVFDKQQEWNTPEKANSLKTMLGLYEDQGRLSANDRKQFESAIDNGYAYEVGKQLVSISSGLTEKEGGKKVDLQYNPQIAFETEKATAPLKIETAGKMEEVKTWASKAAEIAANKTLGLERVDPTTGKPYTSSQFQASGYALRMQHANDVMDDLEEKGFNPADVKNAVISNDAFNAIKNPDMRKYAQATRDFINANLRRESGAAIAATEFDSGRKQYFPQFGDDPETQAQKREARMSSYGMMVAEAGGAMGLTEREYEKARSRNRPNIAPSKSQESKTPTQPKTNDFRKKYNY